MFTAHIFFCVMLAPVPECAIADDTRGPYEAEEKCIFRLGEMQSALATLHPRLKVVAARCENNKGEEV